MEKKEYDIVGKRKPKQTKGFQSELEYFCSEWLTKELKLKTLYEPETFKTKIGRYTPDFYCPEIKTFFECKPGIEFAHIDLYKQFCLEQKKDLVIITPKETHCIEYIIWESGPEVYFAEEREQNYIIFCKKCNKYSFCTSYGIWYCRHCQNHEGAHNCWNVNGIVDKGDENFINFENYYKIEKMKKSKGY